ncbi:hypothetical protein [Paenibacillus sp. UMB4589-SE434]|uniref:hypothetical protein n=1 Tax=Paenibacillus sp. UMB4589-SE434 TaxID=3046314 RepID=UPI00254FD670|nr:hypothetical protein [Paenibacillus sp. UMB4589-SE434]MDK8184047.1 hypothetical protein [Paenibacillus sp. UMB4589-SE434]
MSKLMKAYYEASCKPALVMFVLALLALVYLNAVDGPYSIVRFKQLHAGLPLLDLLWNYSPNQVYEMLSGYGEQGRNDYIANLAVVDILLPILYGLGMGLLMACLIRRSVPQLFGLRHLSLLPLVAALADYGENITIAVMLQAYPDRIDTLAVTANIFTMTKTSVSLVSLGLIVLFTIIALITRLLSRSRN